MAVWIIITALLVASAAGVVATRLETRLNIEEAAAIGVLTAIPSTEVEVAIGVLATTTEAESCAGSVTVL